MAGHHREVVNRDVAQCAYDDGYADGELSIDVRRAVPPTYHGSTAPGAALWWWRQGYDDARHRCPRRTITEQDIRTLTATSLAG